jgi:hypothetical protein
VTAKKACGVILSGKFAILEDDVSPDDYIRLRTQKGSAVSTRIGKDGKYINNMGAIAEEKSAPRMLVEEFDPPEQKSVSMRSGKTSQRVNMSANVNTAVTSVKRVVTSCKSFRYSAQVNPDDDPGAEAPIDDFVAFIKPGAIIGIEHVMLPNTTEWGGLSSVVVSLLVAFFCWILCYDEDCVF